ncbi:hypothetical protein B0H12DRAFT_1132649 [Mycena haematopus]|nr:hypothetical protein B0H12DRAFT_1132649 [Mycena haematopus]
MRPLSLHSSALNDAEYTVFTENLASLLDSDADAHEPETQTLTFREVRAWMRGRYPGVPAGTIDQILALFPSKDTINGGEFFAALRLVLHVEAGKDVDRALAFVQVHPGSAAPSPVTTGAAPEDTVAPARTAQRYNPFLHPPGPPTPSLTRSRTSPFPSPTSSAPAPVLPPRRVVVAAPPVPPPRHPPLPPRSTSPPKPSMHITSTLMKQSLQASKTGQWLKQGQARLEQERVLQVLRSSSTTPRPAAATETATDYISASESSDGGASRGRLPPPRPPSIPPSASSLEQVALASAPTPSPSGTLQRAFDDAYREQRGREPPPMHPDRNRRSAPASVSSRTSASSGSPSRVHRSPERDPEREKPRPPPKPRSLTSSSHSHPSLSSSHPSFSNTSPFDSPAPAAQTTLTRLTRSNSLRPSPPPPKSSRMRPESVHALLGGLGARLAHVGVESPFGDPVRKRGRYTAKEKEEREREREEREREREALVRHGDAPNSHHSQRGLGQPEDDEDSDSDDGPDYEEPPEDGALGVDSGEDDGDGGWVGVQRFPNESDADSASELGRSASVSSSNGSAGVSAGNGQGPGRVRATPMRRDTVTPRALERDSLKWPVDVEGEGWRPL